MEGVEDRGRDFGLLARAVAYGVVAGAAAFYGFLLAGFRPFHASESAFSLAALAFAFGLVGWSGVLMSGRAMEGFSRHLGLSEGFTAESARQAMALVTLFGLGGMVGAALAAYPYGV